MNKDIINYLISCFIIICTIIIYIILIPYSPNMYDYKLQEKLFYNSNDILFYKLKILEHNYKIILSEIPPFDITKVLIKRNIDEWHDNIENNTFNIIKNCSTWVEGWNKEKHTWYNYPLLVNNIIMCNTDKICPQTIKLLKISGIKINVAGYALLLPNTKLMIHRDSHTGISTNTAAVNLKLSGSDSKLYIKDKYNNFNEYLHQDGKAVIFNSELEHYADNNGSTNRYILYMDIKID